MSALQGREKAAPKALRLYSLHRAGERAKGTILSRERMAPFRSPKRTQGALPLDPAHCKRAARRAAQPVESGAVYMASPWIFCESLRLATAPYYREARVTIAWRQTACEIAAFLALAALMSAPLDGSYCALLQDQQSGTRKGCAASVRQQSRQRLRNSG